MICPYCQADNREGAKYCDECGLPLSGMIAQMAAMADGPADPAAAARSERRREEAQAAPDLPDDPFDEDLPSAPAPRDSEPIVDLPDILVEGVNADANGYPYEEYAYGGAEAACDDVAQEAAPLSGDGCEDDDDPPDLFVAPLDDAADDEYAADDFARYDFSEYLDGGSKAAPPAGAWNPEDTLELPVMDDAPAEAPRDFRTEDAAPKKRGRWKAVLAVAAAVIVVAGAGLYGSYSLELWGGKTVPNVVGRTQTDAISMLEAKGFTVTTSEEKSDEAQGVVVSMSPSAGSKIDGGSEVQITVSTARTVPEVAGLQRDEALELLEAEGIEDVTVVTEMSDEHTGTVLSVEPEAGTRVTSDTAVTLTVAVPYSVPDVAGQTLEEAQAALEEVGYAVEVAYSYVDDAEEGVVVSTSPEAGEELSAGSTVTVTVEASRGDELEARSLSYLEGLSTIELGGTNYEISSVAGVTYKGDGTIAFTIFARGYTTVAGELAYTEELQVNGTILFDDDNDITSVF